LYVGRWYDEKGTWHGYQTRQFAAMVDYECQVGSYDDEEEEEDGLMPVYNELYVDPEEAEDESEIVDWPYHRTTPPCWKAFLVELQRIRRKGNMNVLVSDEMICIRGHNQENFHFHMLRDTLSRDWDVRIIATYRRFHAWLPSEKNQYDQYRLSDWAEMPRWLEWEGDVIPPMYQYMKKAIEDPERIKYPFLNNIIEGYGEYFDVQVMNMHDTTKYKTLASQMVCDFIPNATKTCALSQVEEKDNKTASTVLNAAKSGYYDMLAMAANAKGLIDVDSDPERLTRPYVRDQIEWEHEKARGLKPTDFELVCPTREDLQPLLQQSLDYEEQFFPEFHKANKETHLKEFDKMFNKKRYCSIDTEAALKDEHWLEFLKRLNKENIHDIPDEEEEELEFEEDEPKTVLTDSAKSSQMKMGKESDSHHDGQEL